MFESIKKIFSKNKEEKSFFNSLVSCWDGRGNGLSGSQVSNHQALEYYACVDPLADAVDRVASECASIQPVIENKKTGEIVENHPIIKMLEHPSSDCSKIDFIQEIATYLLVTGNCFIHAIGNINRPPIEMRVVSPKNVTITNDQRGLIDTVTVSDGSMSSTFKRTNKNGCDRYLDGNLSELFITRGFNPFRGIDVRLGLSPLNAIKDDLDQYISASIYNLSQLKNSGTGTLYFKVNSISLSAEQMSKLQSDIERKYSGASNTGRVIVTDENMSVKDLTKSTKDMDFFNLKQDVSNRIYNRYRVPLSLISTDSMTYSNMETGKVMLYDNAVLPLTDRIYEKLTDFLLPRYPGSDGLEITYDESQISALALRRYEQLKILRELGVNSDNEIRALIGYESYEGGDKIYKPMNLVPVGIDAMTDDNLDEPIKAYQIYKTLKKKIKECGC